MPKPLSADIRARFERLFSEGLSGREIGRRLMISAASASRLSQRLRQGRCLTPAPNPRNTGRGRLAPYQDFLIELVQQDPDITLKELQGALADAQGGFCQKKVTFRREFPALAFSYEKSVPLFQDFTGHYPTRSHDVREVSTVFASGRGLAP